MSDASATAFESEASGPQTAPGAERSRIRTKNPAEATDAVVLSNRYHLLGELDSGGTAIIHRARDLVSGHERAVKVLKPHAAESPILRALFLAGARAAMGIEHGHVVRILEVDEPAQGIPYAVMELLVGEPLYLTLEREERLSPQRTVELVRGVAAGLRAAHAARVVHCDMKPENLFLVRGDAHEALKIIDFDLASVATAPDVEDGGMLRGTAKYMAPEQVLGDVIDERTDVYALGIVMFRMLTGQLPFELEVGTTLLRHQVASSVPPPSWLVDNLSPELDRIVLQATRKRPEHRYQSMQALLADLEAQRCGQGVAAEPVSAKHDRYRPVSPLAVERAKLLGLND